MRRSFQVLQASILDTETMAVVNASNSSATLGGGVSRALSVECGPELQQEMTEKLEDDLDGVLEVNDCLVTSSGMSKKFTHVLHVQAVDYRGARTSAAAKNVTSTERIARAATAAMRAAAGLASEEQPIVSVAFPLLGAGAGGLPAAGSFAAMLFGIRAFFSEEKDAPVDRVVFAVPEDDKQAVCQRLLADFLK